MAATPIGPFLRHLRKIIDPSRAANVSDAELLERFVRQRDEVAFEVLVWRHQRMVLGVCRRVLRDAHDAEDAFQATFLALARKAASVGRREAVAGWLHTVAYRIALRARAGAAKRARVDIDLATVESLVDPAADAARRDLASVLDTEVSRLPKKYRLPVVLCYLEGKTYPEAGRQLGLAVGTLAGHLTQARALLRTRLLRRGIDLSGALLATLLGKQAAEAAASGALVPVTVKATVGIASGQTAISATVAALTEGVLRSMFVSKLKMAAVMLAGVLVTGIGLVISAALPLPAAVRDAPQPPAKIPEDKEKSVRVDGHGDPLPAGALFRFGSVQMRHDGSICASALSPDGKVLATTSGRSVVLWDLAAGKPLQRFAGSDDLHFCTPGLAFSTDGRYLGYVQCGEFACVWDVRSGKRIAEFAGQRRHPCAICQFTPDGKEFILEDEKRLSFWDLQANKEKHSFRVERASLLSPDGRFYVRIQEKRTLAFIDVQTGKKMQWLNVAAANNGIENGVAFARDGKTLALVHQNKEVQVRDFPGGKLRFSVPLPDSAKRPISGGDYWEYQLSFADGQTLLLGTGGGVIHRWDLATRKELPPLKKHFGAVAGVHILPDGQTIVTTGADGLIRRWDLRTGRELSEPVGYMGRTYAAYSPDGSLAAVGDARGRLELWDARNGRSLRVLQCQGLAVTKLAFAPKGKSLAAAGADNTVGFWDISTGERRHVLHCAKEQELAYVWNMLFSPDGQRLIIVDRHHHGRLWDLTAEKVSWGGQFSAAAFSSDGKTVLTSYAGPYLTLLDAASGKPRAKLRLNTNTPENLANGAPLAISADGQRLAVGATGGDVYLCDARSGTEINHFSALDSPKGNPGVLLRERFQCVSGLAFSPDGKWLSTCGNDGSVRLWEVATGKKVLRLRGHEGEVKQVAFGANSQTLLSCGEDAQAYLWTLRPPMQRMKPSLDSLWSALADEPPKAYRAIWALSEADGATAFLRRKLTPVKPVANERLRTLIADLDSDQFAVREAATKTLAELGEIAAPAMHKTLASKPPLETRKRLEELVKRIDSKTLSAEELRIGRAIDVLERQGSAEARQLLQALADGAPAARTTTEAQAALSRLGR